MTNRTPISTPKPATRPTAKAPATPAPTPNRAPTTPAPVATSPTLWPTRPVHSGGDALKLQSTMRPTGTVPDTRAAEQVRFARRHSVATHGKG